MRPLTTSETEVLFAKLAKYIGRNISQLTDKPADPHCFRVHRDRVYYVREEIAKKAEHIPRNNLLTLGSCFGKFTKTGKFKMHITALDYIAPYARVLSLPHLSIVHYSFFNVDFSSLEFG